MRDVTHLSIPFSDQRTAWAIRVAPDFPPAEALDLIDLPDYRGLVLLHGGAANMEPGLLDQIRHFLTVGLASFAEEHRILVVDGGTHAGTMAAMGDARQAVGGTFPLLGVCPDQYVAYPGRPPIREGYTFLDEAHSHFILVEGGEFGIESDLLVGLLQAAGKPGLALIINGGGIVFNEARLHAQRGNRIVIVRGTERTADELADPSSERRRELPPDARLEIADLHEPERFRENLAVWLR